MHSTITALLKCDSLFADLEDRDLQEVAQRIRRRKFPAQEAIFHEEDEGATLYILVSGHVHIQQTLASGETIHIATRGPGEHFGELSLLDGKPRMADAVTAEPCDLLLLSRTEFIRCVETSPKIALAVMASLADRLREAAQHLAARQDLDVFGRVSRILLNLMETHGVPEPGGGTRLNIKLTQQQLAEQAGTTRETVNRALSSLKDVKAIRSDGRAIIVLRPDRLRRHANT
jgi:CRP/FNR family transcriptional regulator, cyclic AMP receptor protein